MQDLSTYRTRELQPSTRHALEELLGRDLSDDEEISIWTSRPHAAPAGEARKGAWRQLSRHLDGMSKKTGASQELERLVDEEANAVRHRSR